MVPPPYKPKYLCSGPKPTTYEDRAAALLRSFNGDKAKRDESVRKTLQSLKELQ